MKNEATPSPNTPKENILPPVDRRTFLKNSGSAVFLIGLSGLLPQFLSCRDSKAVGEQLKKHQLTAWVQLLEDGQIIIYNPASEMGQGSMTALPLIFAEEMDADWSKVNVEFSPQEAETYGSEGWAPNRKVMLTAGSRATKGYYPIMRKAGAQARHILLYSAALKWNVPLEELSTEPGMVIHENGNNQLAYGELVPWLQIPESLPDFAEEQLKDPGTYRLVGKEIPRTDVPKKVDGRAQFSIDLRLPGMLYAVLERGSRHGARPTLKNSEEILAIPGVLKIVPFEYAIGLIAESLEGALEAKKLLQIDWSTSETSGFNSQETYAHYEKIAERDAPGKILVDIGNTKSALESAAKTYSTDFKNDYVYHAQMEPLNAIVQLAKDGQSAEVWVGSQQGFDSKLGVPQALGIPRENVKIHLQYLGGGFGRRSMGDFVIECSQLAKTVPGRPVKLLWTREDDITYGAYRPLTLQRLMAGTDVHGNLIGLSHCIVGDGGNLVASGVKNEYYAIPNQYAEWREASHGIRLKHWRSVGHGPNKFAIECMLDEVAHDQKIDPIEFRKRLMVNAPRALATLEKVEELSNWNGPSMEGRAKGVAFLEHSGTLNSAVCEISVDTKTGRIKVHHFWNVLDAGTVILPDNVRAQIEGGVLMGMSSVLKERITILDGHVQQTNFHDYHLLRMEDIPDSIEIEILPSNASPKGVGESGTPLVACAIANAFLRLTGKHLHHLPFTPERVIGVLNGKGDNIHPV